jgi:hypothetical protein
MSVAIDCLGREAEERTMRKADDQPVSDRRGFLKLAGAGVVAGSAAADGNKPPPAADSKPASGLYRETEHVKRYYQLARD